MTAFALVDESERACAFATLVSAFRNDPVERWLYPEPQSYVAHFPEFLAAFGGRAFDAQTVWRLGEFCAVALWLPPGTEPDGNVITEVLAATVSPEKHRDLFSVLEQMGAAHPTYPHWYLPWFGVEAAQQGKRLGAELMQHCLRVVDASHLPAYLETPNPRNVAFYERHGFAVDGETRAETCPPVAFMSRTAR